MCGARGARLELGNGKQLSQVHVTLFPRKHPEKRFGLGRAQARWESWGGWKKEVAEPRPAVGREAAALGRG